MALHKSPCSGISLCNLCVLCVSVVWFYSEFINHRDTEDTEVAQRRARSRLFVQSRFFSLAKNVSQRLEEFFGGVRFVEEDGDTFERAFAGAMSSSQTTRSDDSYFGVHALECANRG